MKNMMKFISLALAFVIVCLPLVSCGAEKLSGTYSSEIMGSGLEYKFSGSKVTISIKAAGKVVQQFGGKYEIKGDKITIKMDAEGEEGKSYGGTFDFEQKKDSIKIGALTYKKK